MDETLDEQPVGLEVNLSFAGYYAEKRKLSLEDAKNQLAEMKEKKRLKQRKKHRAAVKAFLENNVEMLMDEENEHKYAEYATCLVGGDDDDDHEKLMKQGTTRFKKLSLIDKYFFHKYEAQKERIAELEAKYTALSEGSLELKENYQKLEADYKKTQNDLKKAKKESKKRKSDVKMDEAAPTAKELKLSEKAKEKEIKEAAKEAAKQEREKQAQLVANAPERPAGTPRAYYIKMSEQTKDEAIQAFGKLTDDEKRELKIKWKEATNAYFVAMKKYLEALPDLERTHVEAKLKLKATGFEYQKFSLEELFPDLPKPPPSNLKFYFDRENKAEIDEKVAAELAQDSTKKKFDVRREMSQKMYAALKDKAKKKLEKKYTKDQDKYESTMKNYYEALSEERQCQYDQMMMKKASKFTPQWLKDEPKVIQSAYTHFSNKMRKANKEDWESVKVTEQARLIGAEWKKLEAAKKAKTVESFEKEKAKNEKAHVEWLNGLNVHQKKMLEEMQVAKKAKGDGPTISGARLAAELIEQMKVMDDDEAKQAYLAEHGQDVEQLKTMYLHNIGIKKKKEKTRKDKWIKMVQGDCKGLIDYCKTLSNTLTAAKKKSATFATEDQGQVQSKPAEKEKAERKPAIGSKKWRQMVDAMAPGHPVPPKLYGIFRAKVKERKIKDKNVIKQMWASADDAVKLEAEAEFATLNAQYKEDVHVWIETLNGSTREEYESLFMRGAKSSDAHNRTAQLKEAGAHDLSYLDLQPKTPAYQMCQDSEDDDDEEDRITELK